jgi:hypothetical protein
MTKRKTVKNKDGLKDEKVKNSPKIRKKFFKEKIKGSGNSNKKVKNATPVELDGVNYKSRLELYMATKLKENGIDFRYEENRYLLIESFKATSPMFRSLKATNTLRELTDGVRSITYTPDFVGEGFVIETKGLSTQVFEMRFKLFRKHLKENNIIMDLYIPSNRKQCDEVIQMILTKRREDSGEE